MSFYLAFYYIALVFAACTSIALFKKVEKVFKRIGLLVLLTIFNEIIAGFLSFRHVNNNSVYHLFTPVEYGVYVSIFTLFLNDERWKKMIFLSVAGLILLEIINTILFQHIDETPTNIMNIESVLLVILSLRLFVSIREQPVYDYILKEGVFWFNSAVLMYYAFDILIWGFHSIVYHSPDPPAIIYHILLLFSGFLYIAYAASILLNYIYGNKTSPVNDPAAANKFQ